MLLKFSEENRLDISGMNADSKRVYTFQKGKQKQKYKTKIQKKNQQTEKVLFKHLKIQQISNIQELKIFKTK